MIDRLRRPNLASDQHFHLSIDPGDDSAANNSLTPPRSRDGMTARQGRSLTGGVQPRPGHGRERNDAEQPQRPAHYAAPPLPRRSCGIAGPYVSCRGSQAAPRALCHDRLRHQRVATEPSGLVDWIGPPTSSEAGLRGRRENPGGLFVFRQDTTAGTNEERKRRDVRHRVAPGVDRSQRAC